MFFEADCRRSECLVAAFFALELDSDSVVLRAAQLLPRRVYDDHSVTNGFAVNDIFQVQLVFGYQTLGSHEDQNAVADVQQVTADIE